MIGQYLWRREEQTKKFDINANTSEDELQKPDAMHVEVMGEKDTRENRT